jgi:hypothetical protein
MATVKSISALLDRSRVIDSFYCRFFKLPENVGNVMGRQVKSISRPEITFDIDPVNFKKFNYQHPGRVTFSPVLVEFFDDENSVLSSLLYVQIMRQLNRYKDLMNVPPDRLDPSERDYRFDIQVDLYNSKREVTESFILHSCYISSLSHQQPEIVDDGITTISVELTYHNVSYKIVDSYVKMLEEGSAGV